ncbi:hypothetical protein D6833_01625, partial [Candidatus Parcubacteria bacterium]
MRTRFLSALRYVCRPHVLAQILAIGALLAVAVAVWPQFTCRVFAACGPREQFCNPDCSQGCAYSSQFKDVKTPGKRSVDSKTGLYFCDLTTTKWNVVPVQCSDSSSCRVTGSSRYFYVANGRSYILKYDQTPNATDGNGHCRRTSSYEPITCCLAAAPNPTPTPCNATYDPPSATLSHAPPYPLVITQDPDELGVDVTVTITGGLKTNSCPGVGQQTIASVTLDWVGLAASSVDWIE